MAKRGRKPNPNIPREGPCQVCGGRMTYTKDQSSRVYNGGYSPVCSTECLRVRQREGGRAGGNKFQSDSTHPKWTGGLSSAQTIERVIDYLVKYGNAPGPEIRKAIGDCSSVAICKARKAVGIPSQQGVIGHIKHGYYTKTAQEARQLINDIRRYIRNGANQ
jgi:hypothetical protein